MSSSSAYEKIIKVLDEKRLESTASEIFMTKVKMFIESNHEMIMEKIRNDEYEIITDISVEVYQRVMDIGKVWKCTKELTKEIGFSFRIDKSFDEEIIMRIKL
jgi:Flp pilus assembly secretin CpaC